MGRKKEGRSEKGVKKKKEEEKEKEEEEEEKEDRQARKDVPYTYTCTKSIYGNRIVCFFLMYFSSRWEQR